jgi:hypothetical protein
MSRRAVILTLLFLWGFAVWGFLSLLRAQAQGTASLTLTWEYGPDPIDRFVLERKQGLTGPWAPLPLAIAATARETTEAALPTGQLFCWRMRAALGTSQSPPSNEVCGAVVSTPTTLRIQ